MRQSFLNAVLLLACAWCFEAGHAAPLARVIFFDVGQGDAILVQSGGCSLLIDAGNLSTAAHLRERLRFHQVERLDRLIIIHPHLDHFGGVFVFEPDFEIVQVHD